MRLEAFSIELKSQISTLTNPRIWKNIKLYTGWFLNEFDGNERRTEALNDSLDNDEKVYLNESKENLNSPRLTEATFTLYNTYKI